MERQPNAALVAPDPKVEVYKQGPALRTKACFVKDALAVLTARPHATLPQPVVLEEAVATACSVSITAAKS